MARIKPQTTFVEDMKHRERAAKARRTKQENAIQAGLLATKQARDNGTAGSVLIASRLLEAERTWKKLSGPDKVNVLSNESTVEHNLLLESEALVKLIKSGASKAECLKLIGEEF